MKRTIKYILFSILALSMVSCLEKMPDHAILEDEAINNVEDMKQAATGIYTSFLSPSLYGGRLTLLPDLQCDFVHAVKGYSNVYGNLWRGEVYSDNMDINGIYSALYNVIARCNFLLEHEDKVRASTKDEKLLNDLEAYCGEAYFARALAYSELLKLFCAPFEEEKAAGAKEWMDPDSENSGVVIMTKYHSEEPLVRSTLRASYAQVISDLDKAAEKLKLDDNYSPTLSGPICDSPYFSEYTVYALRARVALYMKDYENAIKYSTKVIDSGYFHLASVLNGDYQKMWVMDSSQEIIWKVGYTINSKGGALGQIFFNFDYRQVKPDYVPSAWVINSYERTDLRLTTFFKDYQTGHQHHLKWPLLQKYWGNPAFLQKGIVHISMPKPFRLSEQYLIRAEAYAFKEGPDYGKAGKDLGTLHSFRYMNGSPVVSINADNALNVIQKERVRELYMEGFRLMDLKRWHKGFERKPQLESIDNGSQLKYEEDDIRFVWPIPRHELEAPGSQIVGNPTNN